jgi:hypothetical protein
MKPVFKAIFVLVSLSIMANAATGFLKGDRVSGMNKICYYDVLGSTYTLNIGMVELCPLSYDF